MARGYKHIRVLAYTTDFHRHHSGEIHAHHSSQIQSDSGNYIEEGESLGYAFIYEPELLPAGSTSSYYSTEAAKKFISFAKQNLQSLI